MRSYLPDGRVVSWRGPGQGVLDAELADQPVPRALAARYGAHDFWVRWTRSEALAKLADVPIVVWLRKHGLDAQPPAGVDLRTFKADGLVVSLAIIGGRAATRSERPSRPGPG